MNIHMLENSDFTNLVFEKINKRTLNIDNKGIENIFMKNDVKFVKFTAKSCI